MRILPFIVTGLLAVSTATFGQSQQEDFSALFQAQVTRKAELSDSQVANYRDSLLVALALANPDAKPEFYVVVDRNPDAQLLSLFVGTPSALTFVGASPVATGNTGRFDHYITPLGLYEHKLLQDFRAEGTKNEHGIRGYGSKGMRIWDFGWYPATKGWKLKTTETGDIRFQMHATDPKVLEPKLGKPGSKGCVRVPESLNKFMDRYGVLDQAYDEAAAAGKRPWVWAKTHEGNAFSGRFLLVVDTAEVPVGL